MTSDTVLGVIPSRYQSQRFPGKPLADIMGKPMIQWVYERASRSKRISRLIVATDDERIFDVVRKFGGAVEMTSAEIKNGTERAAVIAERFEHPIIVNIQGDEPLIDPAAIDVAIHLLQEDLRAVVGTLVKKIENVEELHNPNLPKVVLDKQHYALYFSRAAIPFDRDCTNAEDWIIHANYYRHIGLYVYRKNFLKEYIRMPESDLEQIEKLEQLRILENGYKIKAAIVDYAPRGIDTPEDLRRLVEFMKENPVE